MEQYIPKAAVVAEIERRLEVLANTSAGDNKEFAAIIGAQYYELINLVQYINTLEVKEVDLKKVHYKPLDEDFERDAVSFCIDKGLNTTSHIAKTIAQHFFELGLKARKEE